LEGLIEQLNSPKAIVEAD